MFEFEENVLTCVLSQLGTSEKSFQKDIDTVRKWVQDQPHFPEVMDDNRIRNFLLLNKCSIEKTKEKIDNYYTMRSLIPDMYLDVDSPEIQKSTEIAYWLALPKMTKDLCRVVVLKLRQKDLLDELDPSVYHARNTHLQELRLKEDLMFQDAFIVDMEGYTWEYMMLMSMSPTVVAKVLTIFEKVYSNRAKVIYLINSLPAVEQIVATVKRVLKPKIFDRISIHKDSKVLLEVFPKEIIPKDYGGDERSMEELHNLQQKKMLEYKDWIKTLNKMRVDEKLRPQKLKNDEFLGFYGNFKSLNVD